MRRNLWNAASLCHMSVLFPQSEKLTDRLVNSPSHLKIKRNACTLQATKCRVIIQFELTSTLLSESHIQKKIPTDLYSQSIKYQPSSISCTTLDKTTNVLLGLLANGRPQICPGLCPCFQSHL